MIGGIFMDEDAILTSTLEELDEKIRTAESGEDAEKFAQAYLTMLEADTLEYRESAKLDTELRKSRWGFLGAAIAAVGAIGAAAIKVIGDLKFQQEAMEFEDNDAYVNYRKHKR